VTLQETAKDLIEASKKDDLVYCPNCKTALQGQFCASCGQNQKRTDRFLFALIAESFEDVFTSDSRASKTFFRLMFKPGALTKEYFRGRRARYVQPLRLYFITSIAFFFLLSVQSALNETEVNIELNNIGGAEESGEVIAEDLNELTFEDKEEIRQGVAAFSADFNLGYWSEETKNKIEEKMIVQIEKALLMVRKDPNEIIDEILELAPPVSFVLLPLFALLLKIVYFNKGRYYTEHLILAVHNHCFIYISLLISGLIESLPENILSQILDSLILFWIPIYLFLSLKNTYDDGWFFTFIKFIVLGTSYAMMFSFAALAALVIGVLNL